MYQGQHRNDSWQAAIECQKRDDDVAAGRCRYRAKHRDTTPAGILDNLTACLENVAARHLAKLAS